MTELVIDIASAICLLTGGLFGIIGGAGLLRFPDFYSRLHAGGVTDTLSAILIVSGLILQSGISLLSFKLFLILVFLLFTTPTASHALARAAMSSGVSFGQASESRSEGEEPPSST